MVPGSTTVVVPYLRASVRARREVLILLFGAHLEGEAEDVAQVVDGFQGIGEYASGGVGVGDVEVAVDEARRRYHLRAVDHPVCGDVLEVGGFAYLGNPRTFNDDGAVTDNPSFRVKGKDEADVFYLDGCIGHR